MKGVIRLGDSTSHGGKVISASSDVFVHGVAVAREGDTCTCPINGHSPCVISDGDPMVLDHGKHVAFEGHKTSCGATLISSNPKSGKAP